MTLDDLIKDLQTAKDIAKENKNPNALVSATLAQAKLLGLDTGKSLDNSPKPVKVVVNVKNARK